MNFNKHSDLAGRHAFLSASKYHWIGYDEDKLVDVYKTALAAQKGTELHELAASLIDNKIKLPRSQKTLNMYVNDAIGFRMNTEQILYYSDNSFGTADAISYRENFLRIHDLKTGVNPASMSQLKIYVALFCLEYGMKPTEFDIELRLYQNDDIDILVPDFDVVEEIIHIMGKIVAFDERINQLRAEMLS